MTAGHRYVRIWISITEHIAENIKRSKNSRRKQNNVREVKILKDYVFSIRIEKSDLDKIRENAKKADMTITAYLIDRALREEQIVILEDLKPVCHEIRKIGTNLNQLTMLAHKGQISCVNLSAFSEEVKKLWQPLNLLTERTKPIRR